MDEANNISSLSDEELLNYLTCLENETGHAVIDGERIKEKVDIIKRRLIYRNKLNLEIRNKLDSIMQML